MEAFTRLPMIIKDIHLYESKGGLRYEPLWTLPLLAPFEKIEYTADVVYRILGENLQQLYFHALIALAFKCPPLLKYMSKTEVGSMDDIVISLNEIVTKAESPIKAVNFYGEIAQSSNGILKWEMIVDI